MDDEVISEMQFDAKVSQASHSIEQSYDLII
jgi:hypothetical protein